MIRYRSRGGFVPAQFSDIVPILANRSYFLILDRDGTLVPIRSNPAQSVLPSSTADFLSHSGRLLDGRVAIVSARALSSLVKEFDSQSIILAGNYGLEISFPSGAQFLHPAAKHARSQISELHAELGRCIVSKPALFLDNHHYSICLHFHRLGESDRTDLHCLIERLEQKYSELSFRRLPTSYEIVPPIEWTKSRALDMIASELAIELENLLYLAFGDSDADEPMFLWVNHRQGISFKVGALGETQALGSADTPADVIDFLHNLTVLIKSDEARKIGS